MDDPRRGLRQSRPIETDPNVPLPPAAVLSSRAAAAAAAFAPYGHSLKGVEARIASVLQSLPFPQPAPTKRCFALVLRSSGLSRSFAPSSTSPDDLVGFPRCSGRKMPQCTTDPSQNPINGAAGRLGFSTRSRAATIAFARIPKVRKPSPRLTFLITTANTCMCTC